MPGILLFLPQAVANSKRYWKRAINLSLPLLLARKREKKMEKLLVRMKIYFVICLVNLLVSLALSEMCCNEGDVLNDINKNNNKASLSLSNLI